MSTVVTVYPLKWYDEVAGAVAYYASAEKGATAYVALMRRDGSDPEWVKDNALAMDAAMPGMSGSVWRLGEEGVLPEGISEPPSADEVLGA